MIVRSQYDLHVVNIKESVLPVCDKPCHTHKIKEQIGKTIGIAELCIAMWFDLKLQGKQPYIFCLCRCWQPVSFGR